MEFDKLNHKSYLKNNKKRKIGIKSFLFFAFSFVIVAILSSAFYGNGGITGNVVESINPDNSVEMETSFSVPEVLLKGEYEEVIVSLDKGTNIKIDHNQVTLGEVENNIVFSDFKGEIEINENNIKRLTGEVSKITINNLPINPQGGKLKVSLFENSEYSSLNISKGVYLEEVFFTTSGTLNVGGDLINLNSEKIEIKNYFGSLIIKDKRLMLKGLVENLDIEGDSRKISLSK